jgi:hypothetical protein
MKNWVQIFLFTWLNLYRYTEGFSAALAELQQAKEKELTKIRDEHAAMTSALTKYSQTTQPVKNATVAISAANKVAAAAAAAPARAAAPVPAAAAGAGGGTGKMGVGEPAAKAAAARVIAGGGGGGAGEQRPGSAMSEYSDSGSDYTDATSDTGSRPGSANPVGR